MEINEIREAVKALPRASNGKLLRVPNELCAEIIREGNQFKGGLKEFSHTVGISYTTVMGWSKRQTKKLMKGKAIFRRVEVKAEADEKRFTVEGPSGLKVMGLKINEIAVLFKEVAL